MTENSILCRFIRDHAEDWRERLEGKCIRIASSERYPELQIFTYGIGKDIDPETGTAVMRVADFSDPVVCECRGSIVKFPELDVVCWPFRKFNNYDHACADTIDWAHARVQEKIDGSLIKLYWYDSQWQWATNGCVLAKEAPLGDTGNFMELIAKSDNFPDIPYEKLDHGKTYMFELVAPENTVVVNYHERKLYHIGTRDNITGQEYRENIGIIRPAEYPLTSLDAVIQFVNNRREEGHCIEHEGCVVVDASFHRVKVKSEDYFMLHALCGNRGFPKKLCVEFLKSPDIKPEEFRGQSADLDERLDYYTVKIKEMEQELAEKITSAMAMLQAGKSQYEVYNSFRNDRMAQMVMKGVRLGRKASAMLEELWECRKDKFLELIEDYPVG